MAVIDDIKKLMGSDKAVVGTKKTLDFMKKGLIVKVYVSSNCPALVRKDMTRYTAVHPVEIIETGLPNDNLGTSCKKPFAVSVLGQLK